MEPINQATSHPEDSFFPELRSEQLSPTSCGHQHHAPRGSLHEPIPLNFASAVERSFLPSLAQELALRPKSADAPPMPILGDHSITVYADGRNRSLPLHLFAEETERDGRFTELLWARNNRRLAATLANETRSLLDSIAHRADERTLGLFQGNFLRGPVGTLPIGRLAAGLAAEMFEVPLTPLGIQSEESGKRIIRWYLVDEGPERRIHRIGSETERLRFCQEVLGEGFRIGHHLLTKPLEAVIALGARLGLLNGLSDERTAYIAAPNDRDCTGHRLALIIRPGSTRNWAPGLEVCWAHHDSLPRPPETVVPFER